MQYNKIRQDKYITTPKTKERKMTTQLTNIHWHRVHILRVHISSIMSFNIWHREPCTYIAHTFEFWWLYLQIWLTNTSKKKRFFNLQTLIDFQRKVRNINCFLKKWFIFKHVSHNKVVRQVAIYWVQFNMFCLHNTVCLATVDD